MKKALFKWFSDLLGIVWFTGVRKKLKRHAWRLILLIVAVLLCVSCNLERSEITTETQAPQETLVPSKVGSSTIPSSKAPSAPATARPVSSPVLEHPDLKIVFTREGNLYLWTKDGRTQLTSSADAYSPKMSPDGQLVAFLRPVDEYHLELWAVNTDGTNERRLVSIADLDAIGGGVRDSNSVAINPYHYDWVPGTHTLAFNTQQVFQGPGLFLLDDLHSVNADNMEIKHILLSGWGGEFVYSPDGSQIAIINSTSIILCQVDGSNYRNVMSYEAVNTYSEYRFYAAPAWSHDGASLLVAIPPKDPLTETPMPTALWTIPTNGTPAFQLGVVMAVPFFEQPVVFSPDRSRLIYLSEVDEPNENRRQLHLARFDGSGDSNYSEYNLLHFLGWSTDSSRFAYNVGENQEAWIGSLETPPSLFPFDPLGVVDMHWVDARNFLYLQQRIDGFEFYLADLNGGAILIDSVDGPPPVYDVAYP